LFEGRYQGSERVARAVLLAAQQAERVSSQSQYGGSSPEAAPLQSLLAANYRARRYTLCGAFAPSRRCLRPARFAFWRSVRGKDSGSRGKDSGYQGKSRVSAGYQATKGHIWRYGHQT